MSDSDRLTLTYANRYPEKFAAEIAAAPDSERLDVLLGLTAAAAGRVTARLPAGVFRKICSEQREHLITWLNASSFDDAVALLVRLPRTEQRTLVGLITDRSTRRRLRQFLNFPSHSVGALAVELPMRVLAETPLHDLLIELTGLGARREQPIVLTDADGLYAGILDIWRLALTDTVSGTAADCSLRIEAVQPELSVLNARNLRQWHRHAWLPVVDHEQRVLGIVTREQILGTTETIHSDTEIIRESIGILCLRYFEVLAQLLERLLGGLSRRQP